MANIFILLLVAHMVLIGGKLYSSEITLADQQTDMLDCGLPKISARPQNRASNVDIFADALYWFATETVDWALILAQNQSEERITFKTLDFDWSPGFRVGVGYNMKHDQWDTQFYYTWFYAHTTEHANGGSGVVQSAFLGSKVSDIGTYQTGKINLNLHFNILDWDLGRSFFVSKALSLRPLIGIKGGWINQSIHTKWKKNTNFLGVPISTTENLKNNFRGIGPKGGVNGKWILGNTHKYFFSLLGDFAGAFMWGHWTIKDKFQDIFQTTAFTKVRDRNFGALMLQGLMGIGFDVNFDKDQSHFSMKLGYEIEDWFNQYQVFDNATGTHNNDLILQGLTLDMRLDF